MNVDGLIGQSEWVKSIQTRFGFRFGFDSTVMRFPKLIGYLETLSI